MIELIAWSNGNGYTLCLTQDTAEQLFLALRGILESGTSKEANFVMDTEEVDIEIL